MSMRSKNMMNFSLCPFPFCRNFDVVLGAINTALTETEHYSVKRQILAIIARDFPLNMLLARFPSIGIHQLKAARKHAMSKGNVNI